MPMKKTFLATVTADRARGGEPRMTISTGSPDRENDEVVPEGGDFAAYKRNPIVMWSHDYSAIPIGTTTSLEIVPGRGIDVEWSWLDGDEFATRVRNAYEQGVIRAASIGFRPLESERNERGGRRFTKWEFLEWSLVAVPANAEAVRTLKRLKLWTDDAIVLRLRSDDDTVVASAAEVRAAMRDALPGAIRDAAAQLIRSETARRGHAADGAFADPFARQRVPIDRDTLRSVLRSVVARIGEGLPELVANELRRSRGRVD
jgi:HK97 family phage prohead protease